MWIILIALHKQPKSAFLYQLQQIMNTTCLNCRQQKGPFVELRCEHQLCLDCAEKIKIPEGLPPLDAKFRICCPTCKTNTITINILNIVKRENQQLLFVHMESSELSQEEFEQPYNEGAGKLSESKLRKMSYTERRSNIYAQRKTPQVTQRNSKASHDSQNHRSTNNKSRQGENIFEVKCNVHKQSLMFFCEQQSLVMCMQCMYKHMKEQKNHNVCSISDAIGVINRQNVQSKSEAKKKMQEIDKSLAICKGNKSRIQQAYQIHEQLICQEFKELQKLIKKKESQNKQFLDKVFKKKEQQIAQQINELNYIKTCLKEHFQFTLDNSSSQIYFFNAYNLLKTAIAKYSISYKQIKKEDFVCFDKLASLQDFSLLLQKFYRPKNDGRESKTTRKEESNAPSRASDKANQNKIKQQFYEQAKKKLERLNKMQNEHVNHNSKKKNGEEYLNNFFIEEVQNKKEPEINYQKGPGSVMAAYRKSSASEYVQKKIIHKTLTPTRISVNQSTTTKSKKK